MSSFLRYHLPSFLPFLYLLFFVSFSQIQVYIRCTYYSGFVLADGFGKMIKLGIGKIGPSSVTIHCASLKSHLISVELMVVLDL